MGLHKNIANANEMWELFTQYKTWIEEHPIKKQVFVGKEGQASYQEIERPLTYEGFNNYVDDKGIITTLDHYFSNYQDRYADFVGVCTRIKRVIRQNQIENGLAGIYNASITQRLNGLVEKTENKVTVEQPMFGEPNED